MHSAFGAQGWIAVQGFLHSWSRHASLLGQSLSSKHSGSYTGTGMFYKWVYEIFNYIIIKLANVCSQWLINSKILLGVHAMP